MVIVDAELPGQLLLVNDAHGLQLDDVYRGAGLLMGTAVGALCLEPFGGFVHTSSLVAAFTIDGSGVSVAGSTGAVTTALAVRALGGHLLSTFSRGAD